MKVLYLHQYFVTPEMAGGTRSYEMARRLVAAGHDVHMLTSDQRSTPSSTPRRWRTENVDGITVHWYPVQYSNRMSFARRLRSFLHFLTAAAFYSRGIKCDVVFATSTPLTIAIPAVAAKRFHGVPMVFEVRDLWPEMPIAVGALRSPILIALARRLERFAYRSAAHIVALSPGMATGIARIGIPESSITVIPNSCDLELFDVSAAAAAEFRLARPWLGDRPFVLYGGTLGLVNGVEYLADVAAEARALSPELRFLVVGDGAGRRTVIDRAKELGILGETFFVENPIPKLQMPAALGAASVACSLFRPIREMEANSANKFFDALAAGRPLAINYGGWQAEILHESGAGIELNAYDHHAAAAQLVEFSESAQRMRAASLAARHLATTRFDRNKLAAQLEAVLVDSATRNRKVGV